MISYGKAEMIFGLTPRQKSVTLHGVTPNLIYLIARCQEKEWLKVSSLVCHSQIRKLSQQVSHITQVSSHYDHSCGSTYNVLPTPSPHLLSLFMTESAATTFSLDSAALALISFFIHESKDVL